MSRSQAGREYGVRCRYEVRREEESPFLTRDQTAKFLRGIVTEGGDKWTPKSSKAFFFQPGMIKYSRY